MNDGWIHDGVLAVGAEPTRIAELFPATGRVRSSSARCSRRSRRKAPRPRSTSSTGSATTPSGAGCSAG